MKFIVVLEPAEEGGFNVLVPALDGCFTQGETEKEARTESFFMGRDFAIKRVVRW